MRLTSRGRLGINTTTPTELLDVNGSMRCAGNITMGSNNSYPDIRLGSENGNNIGIATTAAAFSNSSAVNDMVIRSINRLILQKGSGDYGLMIDSSNSVSIKNLLSVVGSLTVGGTGYISGNTTIAGDTETNAIKTTGSYAYASLGDVLLERDIMAGEIIIHQCKMLMYQRVLIMGFLFKAIFIMPVIVELKKILMILLMIQHYNKYY
jgi:hypothetical protein